MFPLAPLCALINNIFEIRLDARKFLNHYRRPVGEMATDIGVWFKIVDALGKLAVITNGFLIAFASNMIPRLYYVIFRSAYHTCEGYLDFSLSVFDPVDFEKRASTLDSTVTRCHYVDYRYGPDSSDKYERTPIYWHVLAAQVLFFVAYENLVFGIKMFFQWLMPKVPAELQLRIAREQWNLCRAITKAEESKFRLRPDDFEYDLLIFQREEKGNPPIIWLFAKKTLRRNINL